MSQHCLLTAEYNTVQKSPQKVLEFCTFGSSPVRQDLQELLLANKK